MDSNAFPDYRPIRTASMVLLAAILLIGCAGNVRDLMPTPTVYHLPTARAIFDEVPVARRHSEVDLLYITDRAQEKDPDAESPYNQERARSIGFGSEFRGQSTQLTAYCRRRDR